MREAYDFSNARPNPYVKKLKSQVPYQTLISLYLADCVRNKRQLNLSWS